MRPTGTLRRGDRSVTERALEFSAPETVDLVPVGVDDPGPEEIRVDATVSAISAGTELLVYRGDAPTDLPADETIDALAGDLSLPTRYGYATVGTCTAAGEAVDDATVGRRVFAFHPHQSGFTVPVDDVVVVPEDVGSEAAALLPAVETALTIVLDAAPRIGGRVVVFGAGVVGLCTIRLLSSFPLERLVAVEPIAARRELARRLGADAAVAPDDLALDDRADVVVELSGRPETLDDAVDAVGFEGRVVVGSWYGDKRAPVDLGGRFHRDRIEIVSSQVSTIASELGGRWDGRRRLDTAMEWVRRLDHDALITDRVPFGDAPAAYRRLDRSPDDTLQVLLEHP